MSKVYNVAVVVGSLRKASYNRMLAQQLALLAPASLKLKIVEIGDLPLFNQDLESTPPAPWLRFRDDIKAADAVLFITPEYNRGLPAAIKNAIDVGSRPYGASVWNGKPAAIISGAMSALGAALANHQLRQSLVFLNMPTLQQPEAYIGTFQNLFDDKGNLVKEDTRTFLTNFINVFAKWVEKING